MGLLQEIQVRIADRVSKLLLPDAWADSALRDRLTEYETYNAYYSGEHKRALKVKDNQPDDNIATNFVRLAVDRSIALLLGEGIEFDLPGEQTTGEDGKKIDPPNQQYIDEVWEANSKDILLHKAAQNSAIYGTGYIKIIPAGIESRQAENRMLPRLVPLDSRLLTVETNPEDIDTVERYTIRYTFRRMGKDVSRMEVTERDYSELTAGVFMTNGWRVVTHEFSETTGYKWVIVDTQPWEYEFPPIVHWQNLPLANSVYGLSDVTDIIELQDKYNFISSNINRIIRYHAHPKTWGRGAGSQNNASWGPDEMVLFNSPEAHLENLEMQSDLASSQAFALAMRQAIFDLSRTVDISSMSDKLGALTNFGLRVLYGDALAKLGSKQELLGEALVELNHRMLVIGEQQPVLGGEVIWQDPLPTNEQEEVQGLEFDLRNGLLSKESASRMRGYDWEKESGLITAEREAAQQQQSSLGSFLLREFERGGGNNQFGGGGEDKNNAIPQ